MQAINQQLIEKGGMRIIGSFYQGARNLTSKEKVLSPKDMTLPVLADWSSPFAYDGEPLDLDRFRPKA